MIERWFSNMEVAFQEYNYKGETIFAVHIRAGRLPVKLRGWYGAISYVRIVPEEKAPTSEKRRWNRQYPLYIDSSLLYIGMIPCKGRDKADRVYANLKARIKRELGFPQEAEP